MSTMELAADLAQAAARLRADAEDGGLDGDPAIVFADLAEAANALAFFVKQLGKAEGGDVGAHAREAARDLESASEEFGTASYAARA